MPAMVLPGDLTPLIIKFPISNVSEVLLENESPTALLVGAGIGAKWLGAWVADVIPVDASALGQLTVKPLATFTGTAQLLITLAVGDEHIPGVYPLALARQVSFTGGAQVDLAPGARVGLVTGTQLTNLLGSAIQPVSDHLIVDDFGTGVDGAGVIAVNTTLAADANYTTLTVNVGITLHTAGYRIRCTGTLTNAGIIDNSGANGGNAAINVPGAAGIGGAGNTLGAGGTGGLGVGGQTVGNPGTIVTAPVQGGTAGAGGGATSSYLAPAFGAGAAGTPSPTGALGATVPGLRSYTYAGGGGGGSGAGVGTGPASDETGGGGGGGGVILIICAILAGTGAFSVNGGNAGTGFTDGVRAAAGSGGGGGGVCFIFCLTSTFTGTLAAFGGTGSAAIGATGTTDGKAGVAGPAAVIATQG